MACRQSPAASSTILSIAQAARCLRVPCCLGALSACLAAGIACSLSHPLSLWPIPLTPLRQHMCKRPPMACTRWHARNARKKLSEATYGNDVVGQYRVSTPLAHGVSTLLAPAQAGTGRTSTEMLHRHAQLRANSLELLSSSSCPFAPVWACPCPLWLSLACWRECL